MFCCKSSTKNLVGAVENSLSFIWYKDTGNRKLFKRVQSGRRFPPVPSKMAPRSERSVCVRADKVGESKWLLSSMTTAREGEERKQQKWCRFEDWVCHHHYLFCHSIATLTAMSLDGSESFFLRRLLLTRQNVEILIRFPIIVSWMIERRRCRKLKGEKRVARRSEPLNWKQCFKFLTSHLSQRIIWGFTEHMGISSLKLLRLFGGRISLLSSFNSLPPPTPPFLCFNKSPSASFISHWTIKWKCIAGDATAAAAANVLWFSPLVTRFTQKKITHFSCQRCPKIHPY